MFFSSCFILTRKTAIESRLLPCSNYLLQTRFCQFDCGVIWSKEERGWHFILSALFFFYMQKLDHSETKTGRQEFVWVEVKRCFPSSDPPYLSFSPSVCFRHSLCSSVTSASEGVKMCVFLCVSV